MERKWRRLVESFPSMFTGIVEATGRVVALELLPEGGARLTIEALSLMGAPMPQAVPMGIGESLAINGVCLTVQHVEGSHLRFDLVSETLRRTNLGALQPGDWVNLERPLTPQSRIGGHFVQGHVDTTARLTELRTEGNARVLQLQLED
ncbi:MAG: riboflavin synthase, partial [Fimbriimonadales bacterium]|nr:riboflavin synthase [Fimbriimonadales bacterium]